MSYTWTSTSSGLGTTSLQGHFDLVCFTESICRMSQKRYFLNIQGYIRKAIFLLFWPYLVNITAIVILGLLAFLGHFGLIGYFWRFLLFFWLLLVIFCFWSKKRQKNQKLPKVTLITKTYNKTNEITKKAKTNKKAKNNKVDKNAQWYLFKMTQKIGLPTYPWKFRK